MLKQLPFHHFPLGITQGNSELPVLNIPSEDYLKLVQILTSIYLSGRQHNAHKIRFSHQFIAVLKWYQNKWFKKHLKSHKLCSRKLSQERQNTISPESENLWNELICWLEGTTLFLGSELFKFIKTIRQNIKNFIITALTVSKFKMALLFLLP